MKEQRLNNGWEFTPQWTPEFALGRGDAQPVRLPHTVAELPQHYADPADYEMLCGYRCPLSLDAAPDERIFLRFDGAAHIATVFCNGRELVTHRCGYTAFRVELTGLLGEGKNWIALRLDTSENPAIPPFGFVVDYLTYGGVYRDVWLERRPETYISDLFVYTPDLTTVQMQLALDGPGTDCTLMLELLDTQGQVALEQRLPAGTLQARLNLPDAQPWDTEHPALYRCRARLLSAQGRELETVEQTFGFRTAQFRADGFYLNGKKIFLRGLNRHQCLPYVGDAVPERLQREDARILKEELGCNAVRTSHYPQSQYFIDECDRLGLLVFTEIPGWQHIGDEGWKEQACENVREMVIQYRSHPSIVLWGVRINESVDDDEFYTRTNAIAHELDPSRATSGVRYLEKSHLLEDVYAFNDFSHTGHNPGAKPKAKVCPDGNKALLISECNGHMYPTKPYDPWERRQGQALRHARVQDAALSDGGHVGCFGWCMFDYPTHKDFGSGDRICYHGVMDAFRNPKLAAAFYASQGEDRPVLEVGSSMDIGDYPAGNVGPVWVFTNADEVALYKNDVFVTKLSRGSWKALPHPPMLLDDTIGELLETQENMPPKEARLLHDCLLSASRHGVGNMPAWDLAKMGYAMLRYHLKYADGVALFGKYVGNWGGAATRWRFDALKNGQVVASVTKSPAAGLHLRAIPSHTRLTEGDCYDLAAVRVQIVDDWGNLAPYAQLPVCFRLTGPARLVGPETVTAEGGSCGCYLRTTGETGEVTLTLHTEQTEDVILHFSVEKA